MKTMTWLLDLELLHTVEVLQGESFPNLHTIRGTRYRDPELWFKGVDTLRTFPARYMVPSHSRPVSGRDEVAEVLTAYRDGIHYVYDQTIRHMNKGLLPDDLVQVVKLPHDDGLPVSGRRRRIWSGNSSRRGAVPRESGSVGKASNGREGGSPWLRKQ